jgi:monoamine oxidase
VGEGLLRNAVTLDEMDAENRAQTTLTQADLVFPGARQNFEAVRSKSWHLDPWQQGALSFFGPGQLRLIVAAARREGRILFAGEHTSRWNGWMQGALESAGRVVKEISGQ